MHGTTRLKVTIMGVGGNGVRALDALVASGQSGVEYLAVDTDVEALERTRAPAAILLGEALAGGRGTGGRHEAAKQAAMLEAPRVVERLRGADMVVLLSSLGGGTGNGATPVLAQAVREAGVLSVALVTTPFFWEERRDNKKQGLRAMLAWRALRDRADTLLHLPYHGLFVFQLSGFEERAFPLADGLIQETLASLVPGLLAVDRETARRLFSGRGDAGLGIGMAGGKRRVAQAVRRALRNHLFRRSLINEAETVAVHVVGGPDLGLFEPDEVRVCLAEKARAATTVTLDSAVDAGLSGALRVYVLAAGFPECEKDGRYPRLGPEPPDWGSRPGEIRW